jgi:hypothetical protein
MGIEYKISCDPAKVPEFDAFLRRQPFFESYDAEHKLYNLRMPGSQKPENYPDGYAALEPDGIYFCDNLTATDNAAGILRRIIDEALKYSSSVTITEP